MPDVSDLNPVFSDKINTFLTQAQAAGIPAHIISGYRDNSKQAKLYANYQAKRAGQAIPYPEEGSGGVAAPPGGSMHNFGLATDVLANNRQQQDLIAFANSHPELGIKSLGSFDPPHFQLAGDQRALMANPPAAAAGFKAPDLTAWLNGASPSVAEGGSPHLPAFHSAPGTTINSVPMDPSIMARGGVTSPGASGAPIAIASLATASSPSLRQNLQKGDVGAVLAQLTAGKKDAAGNETPGSSALDKLAGLAKPQQQQQSGGSRGGGEMLPQDSTPMIGAAAQQLMAQTFANSAKPLSWSTMPYGSGVAGPQAPGTTLNGVPPNVYG